MGYDKVAHDTNALEIINCGGILNAEDLSGGHSTSDGEFTMINLAGRLLLVHAWCKD